MSDIGAVSYGTAKVPAYSDTTDDPQGPFEGFFTGAGGNIKVHTQEGDDVVFQAAAAGIIIPCVITRVWSTGTVPTNVLGMKARMEP
jgi:hypothetical protein